MQKQREAEALLREHELEVIEMQGDEARQSKAPESEARKSKVPGSRQTKVPESEARQSKERDQSKVPESELKENGGKKGVSMADQPQVATEDAASPLVTPTFTVSEEPDAETAGGKTSSPEDRGQPAPAASELQDEPPRDGKPEPDDTVSDEGSFDDSTAST